MGFPDRQRTLTDFRVLYVEDDDITREIGKLHLTEYFNWVSLATDGREGLDLYMENRDTVPFDLVITDIAMPHMDGLELLSAIKEKDPYLITVIITAHEDKQFFMQAIELGVDYFLSKPVLKKKLFEILDKITSRLQQEQRIRDAEEKIADYIMELEQKKLELEILNRKLDEEMDKARHIHELTLPSVLPPVEGISFAAHYHPAQKLGGDFYDVIKVGDKLIFYLSDVCGHGLDGAMLSVFVKEVIDSYISLKKDELNPANILKHLDQQYRRKNYPYDYFVCIFLVVLDLISMECSYTGAGFHESPLVLTGSGERLRLVREGPPISAVIPDEIMNFREEHIVLTPGTTVLITTDGLSEQETGGVHYGSSLEEVFYAHSHLPPEAIAQAINDDFCRFNNGSLQGKDDITFLVLQLEKATS